MNYLVRKQRNDARLFTCGLKIPDGFFLVTSMTFDNQKQLQNVRKFGYIVETTDLPEGTYTPAGLRVDPISIWDHYVEKKGPLRYLDETPVEGADVAVEMPVVRPPDPALRPPTPSLDDLPMDAAPALPDSVLKAMERNRAPAPTKPPETPSDAAVSPPSVESEIQMLRTALTARGIDWHPRNNAASLRAKLEESDAA